MRQDGKICVICFHTFLLYVVIIHEMLCKVKFNLRFLSSDEGALLMPKNLLNFTGMTTRWWRFQSHNISDKQCMTHAWRILFNGKKYFHLLTFDSFNSSSITKTSVLQSTAAASSRRTRGMNPIITWFIVLWILQPLRKGSHGHN